LNDLAKTMRRRGGLFDEIAAELAALEALSSPEPSPRPRSHIAFGTPDSPRMPDTLPERADECRRRRARPAGTRLLLQHRKDAVCRSEGGGADGAMTDRSDALALELAAAHERALCREREAHQRALGELEAAMRAEQQAHLFAMARSLEADFQASIEKHRTAEREALVDARALAAQADRLAAELECALRALADADAQAPAHAAGKVEGEAVRALVTLQVQHEALWLQLGCGLAQLQRTAATAADSSDQLDARAQEAQDRAHAERREWRAAIHMLQAELHAMEDAGQGLQERARAAEARLQHEHAARGAEVAELRASHARQLQRVEQRVHAVVRGKDARLAQLEAELADVRELVRTD
jgi:hypothetical protein